MVYSVKIKSNFLTGDIKKDGGELKRQGTVRALPRRLSDAEIKSQDKPIPDGTAFFVFSKTNW